MGSQAAASNVTGARLTAMGYQSLFTCNADDCSGYGYQSLLLNTGIRNSAFGAGASRQNTTATNCCSFGYNSQTSNQTGVRNTSFGSDSMPVNTTGNSCNAFGFMSLRNNDGIGNMGIGAFANGVTTGFAVYGIGNNACLNYTNGTNSIGIGDSTQQTATSSTEQVSIGHNTLAANTGNQNTVMGHNGMIQNTTGSNCTIFGNRAYNGATSGDNCICIGSGAGGLLINTSNNIDIGNSGDGTDTGVMRFGTAGTHNFNFQAGIRGVVTTINDAVNVVVDSAGQLGVTSSALHKKYCIRDLDYVFRRPGDLSVCVNPRAVQVLNAHKSSDNYIDTPEMYANNESLFASIFTPSPHDDVVKMLRELRPVQFVYNEHTTPSYGLVADYTAIDCPHLVTFKDGKPDGIRYHELSTYLLAGWQRTHTILESLCKKLNIDIDELDM
jgi:hypothetical protein